MNYFSVKKKKNPVGDGNFWLSPRLFLLLLLLIIWTLSNFNDRIILIDSPVCKSLILSEVTNEMIGEYQCGKNTILNGKDDSVVRKIKFTFW